jgi:hypothetical protein
MFGAGGVDGSAGVELPPTSVAHYTTYSDLPFIKVFGNYFDESLSTQTTSRHPMGPIYCVDVTTDERRIFLGIWSKRDTLAPKEVEAFLDTLVKSVEILR